MYTYECKIIKVTDGDTVVIDIDLGFSVILANQKIRLAGIDTPESRTSNKEVKERGMLSKKKLAEKLPVGSKQIVQTIKLDDNDDKFGRILGVFSDTNGTVNQWMIDNNYAVNYSGESKELIQEAHQSHAVKLRERGEITTL